MTNDRGNRRVALVLGAGGERGGQWIRGAFEALEEATGFTPNQAAVLQGTSIGAFISGRIGNPQPLGDGVFERLAAMAEPLEAPTLADRVATTARLAAGNLIALACPPGRQDPRSWIKKIEPDSLATVVSARCWPPGRRAAKLSESSDPAGEIAASGAVPIGAKPVELDGARHTDGAVISVTNADLISPGDADLLIVIAPLVATDGGSVVSRSGRHQLAVELAPWQKAGKPVIVLAPSGEEYAHRADLDRHYQAAKTELLSRSARLVP